MIKEQHLKEAEKKSAKDRDDAAKKLLKEIEAQHQHELEIMRKEKAVSLVALSESHDKSLEAVQSDLIKAVSRRRSWR